MGSQLVMYEEELQQINHICDVLHRDANAKAVLVIDKQLAELRKLADRIVILEKGRVVWQGAPADADGVERHLHV